jgi:hypothetical protein
METKENYIEYFEFFDNLRESGITNMYGAGPFLAEEFNLSKKKSTEILLKWMETFDNKVSVEERVDKLEVLT